MDKLQLHILENLYNNKNIPYNSSGINIITESINSFVDKHEVYSYVLDLNLPWYKRFINWFYPVFETTEIKYEWRKI